MNFALPRIRTVSVIACAIAFAACGVQAQAAPGSASPLAASSSSSSLAALTATAEAGFSWSQDPFDRLKLPAPSLIPLTAGNELPSGSVQGGAFRTEVGPDNVTRLGSMARFEPNWSPQVKRQDREVAWAMYMLNMHGQSHVDGFQLDWQQAPAEKQVWVGLAHWKEDRWVWRRIEAVEEVPVPSTSPFVREADGALSCVLLTLGDQPTVLERIHSRGGGHSITPPGGLANEEAYLGTNLARIRDWNSAVMFLDAFRHARTWIPQTHPYDWVFDTGADLHIDADGHITHLDPGTAAAAVVLSDQEGIHPAGIYTLLYDGVGKLEVRGEGRIQSEEPGRILVDITPKTGLTTVRIVETDPLDPVRNLRLILPGFEKLAETKTFHPDFIASLEPFDVIRFMDWGVTNETEVSTWAERARPGIASFATHAGVPIETMVALCNEVDADLWYCVPHLADEDFVRRATTLIRNTLNPELRLHLEYSNEVWNWMFPQARWAQAEGEALGYESNVARFRYYADRSIDVMDVATQVFATEPDRLVRVLGSQSANPWVGTTIMDWPPHDPAHLHADALAVAPYFGGGFGTDKQAPTVEKWSVEKLLDECELDSIMRQGSHTSGNAANAESRGLDLVAYEGGQHLVGVEGNENNATLTALFHAANAHPEMRRLYLEDLQRWDQNGGQLFMAFTHVFAPSKWGAWGMLDNIYQDRNQAPKWMGVMDWRHLKENGASQ